MACRPHGLRITPAASGSCGIALSAKKGKTARKDFVEMQETIDAIDRALTDERDVASKCKSPV